jgi:NADPH-dependent 2,4-dienoyl-CoA reductase/sulfur reductase-like enzyme
MFHDAIDLISSLRQRSWQHRKEKTVLTTFKRQPLQKKQGIPVHRKIIEPIAWSIMCRPTTGNVDADDAISHSCKNIVIAGAGPAGLLLTALLMQRNRELPEPLYHITLVDGRQDLGQFSTEELKKSFRSWMLGLVREQYAKLAWIFSFKPSHPLN